MGVPPTGQVAIAVAQRGVLQNPGGATGNLGGAAAARRGETRDEFRREVARQIQNGQAGTPTNGNNPVATQLLLAPTFTPIQANAVLDQTNMRIAVPVRQVDGEYILTMQVMGAGARPAEGQAQGQATPEGQRPTESQAPTAAQSERPFSESQTPTAEAPRSSASAEAGREGERPAEPATSNGTETAKPERRQESANKDKYGLDKPPQGAVIVSMKEIDTMANAVTWGGQAPITEMMGAFYKEQTGKDLFPAANATSDTIAKITV